MITLSAAEKQYLLNDDYRVEMEVNTVNEDNITITEANLVQGSFAANRFSCVGNTIEVGSANAAEISFTLRNDDGTFDDVVFEGAQVIVWLRRGTSGSYSLNLRLFTARVDEVHHAIDSIQLVLLDSMVKLDRTAANLTYNTPAGVIDQICSDCGIAYNSAKSSLKNGTVELATPTTENLSYRQVLMWIAQITGTCAFIDPEDKLVLGWYTKDDDIDDVDYIKKSNRFSSDLDENEIIVTGVSATVGETTYQSKDDSVDVDYLIAIEGNELISETNVTTILAGLFDRVDGFAYTPFSATTMNLCWLLPLDMTEFWDKDDNPHDVIITDWTFTPHSSLQLAGKGESATRKGYASNPPFTAQQSRIIEKLKRDVENVDVDDRITAVLGLNDAINHGMMLHTTTVDDKEYRHNAALLEDSTYICTANSGGFAWTNSGWNDGDPVWEYGISSDGSAVLEQLSAYAISADVVSAGILQSKDGSTTLDMNNGTASFFNRALLYDAVNGFRFGTTVTFGKSNLGQDVIDFIESQGGEDDGINVHATAGTLSGNDYPLTTTEQVTELAEGDIVAITFPNGVDFTLNTSGSTYLYKPRTVSIGNNTYTLLNANGTTDWCNVKDSADYSGNVTVKYIARLLDSTLKLCELVEVENVIDKEMGTSTYAFMLKPTEPLTTATTGTVLNCDISSLQYGMAITQQSNNPSYLQSPFFDWNSEYSGKMLLSKNEYSGSSGFADAYSMSDLEEKGDVAPANYKGTSSTGASDQYKYASVSGFSLRDGVTVDITFTNANSAYAPYLNVGATGNNNIYIKSGNNYSPLDTSSPLNWGAGETRRFTYESRTTSWLISAPTTYYSPKDKTSVNIIIENLRTSSGTTLRAFELRFDPVSTQPAVIAIDEEAREAADRALIAAMAASTAVNELDSDVDSRISDAIAGITVEGTVTTFYGTCGTSEGTAAKVVNVYKSDGSTLDDSFTLKKGAIINVSFTYANTATTPTLNVNGTGAKAIYVNNAQLHYGSSYTTNAYNWKANTVVQFMYDGSYWRMSQTSADLILANFCADNNMTVIDGSKIYAGTVTSKKIQANSIYATDALLGNLMACNATITGILDVIGSQTTKTLTTAEKNYIAQAYWGLNYSDLAAAAKLVIDYEGTLLKNGFQSKIRVGIKENNTFKVSGVMTPLGLVVGNPNISASNVSESGIITQVFGATPTLGYYGMDAFIPGDIFLKGHKIDSDNLITIRGMLSGVEVVDIYASQSYTDVTINYHDEDGNAKEFINPPIVNATFDLSVTSLSVAFSKLEIRSKSATRCTVRVHYSVSYNNTALIDWVAIGDIKS